MDYQHQRLFMLTGVLILLGALSLIILRGPEDIGIQAQVLRSSFLNVAP